MFLNRVPANKNKHPNPDIVNNKLKNHSMKKSILEYSTLVSLFFLAACSSNNNTDKQAASATDTPEMAVMDKHTFSGSYNSNETSTESREVVLAGIQDIDINEDDPQLTAEGEVDIDVKSSTARHQYYETHQHSPVRPLIRQMPVIKETPELTNAQRFSGVLAAHNGVRAKHGLTPLKWSNKLANYSQQWANHLGKGSRCKIAHRGGIPPYGENLYRASSLRWSDGKTELLPVTIKNVVKAWTDEEKWYDYTRNRCQPGQKCGHYTQIVWRDTTEVGCAVKICDDKSQTWVCSYNPPGNFQGVRPY